MTTFEEFVERSSWPPGTFVKDIIRWHHDGAPKTNHVSLEDTIRILESSGYVVNNYIIQASPLTTHRVHREDGPGRPRVHIQ